MPISPKKLEVDLLKTELKQVKKELDDTKKPSTEGVVRQVDNSEEVLNNILDKGVIVFETWTKSQTETQKYAIDKSHETEIKRFEVANEIDKRGGIIKTILVFVSIISLCGLAYIDKLGQGAVAILVLVVSTMLRDNVKDLFNDIYKGFRRNNNDD